MGEFFVYILKSTVCLALFYLFYRLLLSKETFHRFNRIALLGLIVLSVVIPFIRFVTDKPVAIQQPVQNLESLLLLAQTETVVADSQSVWLQVLCLVYVAGCIGFFLQFLYSAFRIRRLIREGEKRQLADGIRLVITNRQVSPFSWMNYVVISRKDMEESEKEILTHELAHIHARHSVDMLIAGLCVILHWFNPAVWLVKLELQNIHEYEADESVLNKGIDAKKYQLLLIKKAVGPQRFTSMANSFNHSKLKKRITMMLRQKSSPWARLKYVYVLPLTAVAVTAFARPEISRELQKISSVKVMETASIPQVIMQEKNDVTKIDTTVVVVKSVDNKEGGVDRGTVFVTKKESTFLVTPDNDSVFVVGYGSHDNKGVTITSLVGKENIESAKEMAFSVLSANRDSSLTKDTQLSVRYSGAHPLIIVDGKETSKEDMGKLNPEDIKSISVLKAEVATEIYKEKGKDGVILIDTKTKDK